MSDVISLQTIADQAGVTRTTVSLALRHHPRISFKTGERVRDLARTLGYEANANLSRAMRGIRAQGRGYDPPRLAFVHAGGGGPEWRQAVSRACQEQGYRTEVLNRQPLTGEWLGKVLHTRNIAGLLLSHPAPSSILQAMDTRSLCLCVVSENPVGHHRIDPRHADPDWIAREAVALLDHLLLHHCYGRPAQPKVIHVDQPGLST